MLRGKWRRACIYRGLQLPAAASKGAAERGDRRGARRDERVREEKMPAGLPQGCGVREP